MKSITKLTGRVIFKGNPGYEAARKNWDPHTDRFPKVFVFAQKTQDVANAIRWARKNNVPFAREVDGTPWRPTFLRSTEALSSTLAK